jgi:hypothetical protein
MTLIMDKPFRYRGRATHSLPGDVVELRKNLSATMPGGQMKRLTTGLYVIMGQRDNALVLARAAEDEDDEIIAEGPAYGVPVHILETDTVGVTFIRARV